MAEWSFLYLLFSYNAVLNKLLQLDAITQQARLQKCYIISRKWRRQVPYKVSKSLRTADLLYVEKREKGLSFKNLGGFKAKWLVA